MTDMDPVCEILNRICAILSRALVADYGNSDSGDSPLLSTTYALIATANRPSYLTVQNLGPAELQIREDNREGAVGYRLGSGSNYTYPRGFRGSVFGRASSGTTRANWKLLTARFVGERE